MMKDYPYVPIASVQMLAEASVEKSLTMEEFFQYLERVQCGRGHAGREHID